VADPAYPMQLAISAALLADAATVALIGQAVYDPLSAAGAPYDYIEIGDDEVVPCDDGMCDEVWTAVDILCAGPAGRLKAKQVAAAVRAVLAPTLSTPNLGVTGVRVISGVLHSAKYPTEDDPTQAVGAIAHGQLQFRFQTVPTT
jgi:hypothetical protein